MRQPGANVLILFVLLSRRCRSDLGQHEHPHREQHLRAGRHIRISYPGPHCARPTSPCIRHSLRDVHDHLLGSRRNERRREAVHLHCDRLREQTIDLGGLANRRLCSAHISPLYHVRPLPTARVRVRAPQAPPCGRCKRRIREAHTGEKGRRMSNRNDWKC